MGGDRPTSLVRHSSVDGNEHEPPGGTLAAYNQQRSLLPVADDRPAAAPQACRPRTATLAGCRDAAHGDGTGVPGAGAHAHARASLARSSAAPDVRVL